MTDAELERINRERRRRGLQTLTRQQATSAVMSAPTRYADGFNSSDFLISYITGINMSGSTEGMLGAMMHPSESRSESYSSPAPEPTPSYDSSPSYDSGGGSGGGDSGTSGGGE